MTSQRAGELDCLVTIVKRSTGARDAGGAPTVTYADQTPSLYAQRTDVSDGERMSGQGIAATLRARFRVRAEDGAGVIAQDRIRDEDVGELFDVVGVKRRGSRWLEITAGAQADG